MKTKFTYAVQHIDGDYNFYDVTTKSKDYNYSVKLKFSKMDHGWSAKVKGKTAAKLKDDGNGVEVSFSNSKGVRKFDHSEWEELRLLMLAYDEAEGNSPTVNMITKAKDLK